MTTRPSRARWPYDPGPDALAAPHRTAATAPPRPGDALPGTQGRGELQAAPYGHVAPVLADQAKGTLRKIASDNYAAGYDQAMADVRAIIGQSHNSSPYRTISAIMNRIRQTHLGRYNA